MYEPHLEKMIEIKKQIAAKLGYEKHPYDALLDTFEEQLTVDNLDKVFGALTPRIQKILKKTRRFKQPVLQREQTWEFKV
jgi:carboxypeptidase Taq